MNLNPFIDVLILALDLFSLALIIYIILTWLLHFGIVNRNQVLVQRVYAFLYQLMEPVLRYLRRYIPGLGGVDISPIVLFLLIYFLQRLLYEYFYYRG